MNSNSLFNKKVDPSEQIAISVQNVTKSFKLPLEKASSFKQSLFNAVQGKKGYEEQIVLDNISFTIKKGEFVGIVGKNGSGKSTLLKLLAQIYFPDKGKIDVTGVLVPFIELGVGFSPELTGRENVYLNGALMGFSTKQIDGMYKDIVDFAELSEFMEQKIKNYSSGMLVRLAFSMAIRAQSDILLLDEILAVGDEAFQRKCYAYFAKLKREKKTVILVTHSMDSVQKFCTRALMIEQGKITIDGNTSDVAMRYREVNNMAATSSDSGAVASTNTDAGVLVSCKYENVKKARKLNFDIEIVSKEKLEDVVFTFVIQRDTGEWVYRFASDEKMNEVLDLGDQKPVKMQLHLENIFPNGNFEVLCAIKKKDRTIEYYPTSKLLEFEIVNDSSFANDGYWKPDETFSIDL